MITLAATAIEQTTPTAPGIADVVSANYNFGDVLDCALLRRGFNHVYGLRFADGKQAVARLAAARPRGATNITYEAALLAHLKTAGAVVAARLPTRQDGDYVLLALTEGARELILFDHLEGETPGDCLVDIEATGRGLALLHAAGNGYNGPQSHYTLELPYLLDESLKRLLAAPTLDAHLRSEFSALADQLNERIAAMADLTRVHCHGDCHGSNNFVNTAADGSRVASFFDFDDAGPGQLAYDIGVFLWVNMPQSVGTALDGDALNKWRHFLAGYRSVRSIDEADFAAIMPFVAVRQFWSMGEYAGRFAVWGTQAMPTSYLRKQAERMRSWGQLATPQ